MNQQSGNQTVRILVARLPGMEKFCVSSLSSAVFSGEKTVISLCAFMGNLNFSQSEAGIK